ncbi:MAG: hypothetical protein WD187_03400 [Candidatus Woykebacteria bacterium]
MRGIIIGSLLAVLLLLAVGIVTSSSSSAQDQCTALTFEGLPAGTILGEQYAPQGVHITGVTSGSRPDAVMVFDSDAVGTPDPDLEVTDPQWDPAIGNLAILPDNLKDGNGDGLADQPNDSASGGTQIYTFDEEVKILGFAFVDSDREDTTPIAVAYDGNGATIKEVPIKVLGDGSVQAVDVQAEGVRRLEIVYADSGGVTLLQFCKIEATPTPTPEATSIPSPTPTPEIGTSISVTPTPEPQVPTSFPDTGGEPERPRHSPWGYLLLGVGLWGAAGVALLVRDRWLVR